MPFTYSAAFYIQYDLDIGLQGYDLWYVRLRWDRSVISDEAVSPRLWLRDVNCEVRGVLQRVCLLSGQTSRGSPRGESPESHLASSGHPSSIHPIAMAKALYVLLVNWRKKWILCLWLYFFENVTKQYHLGNRNTNFDKQSWVTRLYMLFRNITIP